MPNPLRKFFRRKEKSLSLLTGITSFSGFDSNVDIYNLDSYKKSLYLYIGVSMIAKRAAGVELELYKIKNRKGDVTEVYDHPLLALLASPNSLQTQREFMELSYINYLLSGDCFWYLSRVGGKITEMYTLRPDKVQILLSPDQKSIIGYEYQTTTLTRFAPEDVLHIKNIDPSNPLRGVGVVRPATARILTELEATKYQGTFFKNQGRPDFVMMTDSVVTNEAADEARADWKRIFGGGKSGQLGVFGSNVKDLRELNKTPKEMDFIETQKFLRSDILAALHIPEEMVSSDGSNRATSKEAYKMYLQEAVIPVIDAFLDVLNNRLIPQVDDSIFFAFDDPVPVDAEQELKRHTAAVGKWLTQNEIRQETGYAPIEGGDELGKVSFGGSQGQGTAPEVQETAKSILRRRTGLVRRLKAIEEIVNLTLMTEPKRERNSIFPSKSAKEGYAKAYNEKVDKKAKAVKQAIDKFHEGMLERVLASDLTPNNFMDVTEEKVKANSALRPVMIQLYKDGGQDALNALFAKSAEQFVATEVLVSAIEARVKFFTNSIVDTTFEVLKSKIVDGIVDGDGVDKIGQSIRSYFADMSVGRAKTIARTETGYALSKATNDAYAQSTVVTGKEWISAGDADVRDEHQLNDGQIVGKDEAFNNGEQYPGEQSINCRCTLAPSV